jgi:hypothetical protein
MARDAIDIWCEQQPDVSNRKALEQWLDSMPTYADPPRPSSDDGLVYKVIERPPPVEKETLAISNDYLDVARGEAMQLVETLADFVGEDIGKLAQRNSELEHRVRELEVQFAYEKRVRELELKIIKLSADMDADHSRTAAPLIPLKGGRGSLGIFSSPGAART